MKVQSISNYAGVKNSQVGNNQSVKMQNQQSFGKAWVDDRETELLYGEAGELIRTVLRGIKELLPQKPNLANSIEHDVLITPFQGNYNGIAVAFPTRDGHLPSFPYFITDEKLFSAKHILEGAESISDQAGTFEECAAALHMARDHWDPSLPLPAKLREARFDALVY